MSLLKLQAVMKQRLNSDLFADNNLKNHGSKAVREKKQYYDDCVKSGKTNCNSNVQIRCYPAFVRVYMDKYFPVAEHRAASRLITNLRSTFVQDIVNKITWIDPQTKKMF